MTTRLLHHDLGTPEGVSPFDEAILEVANAGPLQIVCPYIGLKYLKRILDGIPDWFLVTDVEAWLSSLSTAARAEAGAFILGNQNRVRHIKGVHAKAVIGAGACYFGSANLTTSGILGRTELGLFSAESAMLAQLHHWFKDLWETAAEVTVDQVRRFSEVVDDQANAVAELELDGLPELHAGLPKVRAKLAPRRDKTLSSELPPEASAVDWFDQFLMQVGNAPFRLLDVLQYARGLHPSMRKQEVEQALFLRCGNHPDTLFDLKVRRQLLWSEGAFQTSTNHEVRVALALHDRVLMNLTLALDFDDARRLGGSERGAHLSARAFENLVDALVASEFLLTTPDKRFTLNEGWEWGTEFLVFTTTEKLWQSKFDGRRVKHGPSVSALPNTKLDSTPIVMAEESQGIPRFGLLAANAPEENVLSSVKKKRRTIKFEQLHPKEPYVLESRVDLIYKAVCQLVAGGQFDFAALDELAVFLVEKLGEEITFVQRILRNEDIVGEPLIIFKALKSSKIGLRLNLLADTYQLNKTFNFLCDFEGDVGAIMGLSFSNYFLNSSRFPPEDRRVLEREYRDARHTGDRVFAALVQSWRRNGRNYAGKSKNAVLASVQRTLNISDQDMQQFKTAVYAGIIPEVARLEFNDSASRLSLVLRYATLSHLQAFPLTKAALGAGPPYDGFVWFEGVV